MLLIRDVSIFTYTINHRPQALVICRNPPVDNMLKAMSTNSLTRSPSAEAVLRKVPWPNVKYVYKLQGECHRGRSFPWRTKCWQASCEKFPLRLAGPAWRVPLQTSAIYLHHAPRPSVLLQTRPAPHAHPSGQSSKAPPTLRDHAHPIMTISATDVAGRQASCTEPALPTSEPAAAVARPHRQPASGPAPSTRVSAATVAPHNRWALKTSLALVTSRDCSPGSHRKTST